MKYKRTTNKVSREMAKRIILNTEPALTTTMVDKYTDSELKEWLTLLGFKAGF